MVSREKEVINSNYIPTIPIIFLCQSGLLDTRIPRRHCRSGSRSPQQSKNHTKVSRTLFIGGRVLPSVVKKATSVKHNVAERNKTRCLCLLCRDWEVRTGTGTVTLRALRTLMSPSWTAEARVSVGDRVV